MPARLVWLSLFVTLLSSCSVVIPDVKLHSVSGRLQAGMDWAYTGHDQTGEIGMAESIRFLEAGALCMSAADFTRQKTAIESACYKLGSGCSYEVKQAIEEVNKRVVALQTKRKK